MSLPPYAATLRLTMELLRLLALEDRTGAELRECLGMSRASVHRLIRVAREILGAPVEWDAVLGVYRLANEGWRIDRQWLAEHNPWKLDSLNIS